MQLYMVVPKGIKRILLRSNFFSLADGGTSQNFYVIYRTHLIVVYFTTNNYFGALNIFQMKVTAIISEIEDQS